MRRTLIGAVMLLLATAPAAFAGGTWNKTIADAQKVAKAKKQLILVDMYADWCGWCKRFEREVFPSAAFQQASSDLILLRLDTEDGAEGTKYARKFSVTSLPTFLLLTPDLTLAGTIRGYLPPAEFAAALKQTRGSYESFATRLKNESKIAKDYQQRMMLANELGERQDWDAAELRLRKLTTEKGVPVAIRDEAYYKLATLCALTSRSDEGLKLVRTLTSLSKAGDSVERARILAGKIYLQQGNLLGAANEFRSFKAAFPNSPLVREVDVMLPDIERRLSKGK